MYNDFPPIAWGFRIIYYTHIKCNLVSCFIFPNHSKMKFSAFVKKNTISRTTTEKKIPDQILTFGLSTIYKTKIQNSIKSWNLRQKFKFERLKHFLWFEFKILT